jgi:tetratricopeptide (TPR) repeat protein
VITQELLDELWDFEDPAGSYQRLADEEELPSHTGSERAELVTQRARALGLQGRFDDGHALLQSLGHSADDADAVVWTRIALETGRLLNSADSPAEALPQFETAVSTAGSGGLLFLQIDALHMLAIADKSRSGEWVARAIDLAMTAPDDRTRRWLVSLYNNLGWTHFDAGSLQEAHAAFLQAQEWAERVGTEQQRVWAREAIEECATAMSRSEGGTLG